MIGRGNYWVVKNNDMNKEHVLKHPTVFQEVKVRDYDSVGSLAWCKANFRCGITFMCVCIFAKLFPLQFNLFLRLE